MTSDCKRWGAEMNDYEFIAMNNIKRAALALHDGDDKKVEDCVQEVLECIQKSRLVKAGLL